MLFNSIQFCIFFPLVTIIYFLTPHRARWSVLLLASCYFYMAFVPVYILILAFTILVDYVAGILIEGASGARRRALLAGSLVANIGALFIFKYYNFLNDNLRLLATALHWNYSVPALSMLLPIGLSFHTFQAMSYTLEVYRGRQPAERHLGIYALYVMFYPQLVAGPIERPQNLIHQFREPHSFEYRRVTDGLRLMGWGFFKKIVVADRLAASVNVVYGDPGHYTGFSLIVATYFFAIQIYCDFSGYSDIALGCAEVMGFKLMKNFDRPYAAESIGEFWRRWHISLSTWFRDYLYKPLRDNAAHRAGQADYRSLSLETGHQRWLMYRDIVIVFLVSGLWHGANWTYLIWGLLHAAYRIVALTTRGARDRASKILGLEASPRLRRAWRRFAVFHLATFAWIFFRANTLNDATYVVKNLFHNLTIESATGASIASKLGVSRSNLAMTILFVLLLFSVEHFQSLGRLRTLLDRQPTWMRWGLYYGVGAAIVFFGEYKSQQFIYFQF